MSATSSCMTRHNGEIRREGERESNHRHTLPMLLLSDNVSMDAQRTREYIAFGDHI